MIEVNKPQMINGRQVSFLFLTKNGSVEYLGISAIKEWVDVKKDSIHLESYVLISFTSYQDGIKNVFEDIEEIAICRELDDAVDLLLKRINMKNWTRVDFTTFIATFPSGFGVWHDAAKIAIRDNRVDEYISSWFEQDDDEGSRPMVRRSF